MNQRGFSELEFAAKKKRTSGRAGSALWTRLKRRRPDRCRCCGTPFPADAPTKGYNGRYELDVITPTSGSPGLEVRHTRHVYQQRQCSCGHWTHAEPGRCAEPTDWQVELTEWHLAGPTLVALICALSLRQRVSRRGIQEFLADWLGVSLSIAAIHQCTKPVARSNRWSSAISCR